MALGYGLQMATIMQQSNRMDVSTRHEQEAKIELSTRIQASTFLRADCATQVQILQAMIASFRIVVETDLEGNVVGENWSCWRSRIVPMHLPYRLTGTVGLTTMPSFFPPFG